LFDYIITFGDKTMLIGASGAISAVTGAYYLMFKNSRIKTVVFLLITW